MSVKTFLKHHFRHFNAATLVGAAEAYAQHIEKGGKMFLTMAGAMSTAELGLSLAEMIRREKIHAVCCTGANLEEDVFNLIGNRDYVRVPHHRYLSAEDEALIRSRGLCRVTDTCIPEDGAMRKVENQLLELWKSADRRGERSFPHEYIYTLLRSGVLEPLYQVDPKDSWVMAACEKNLPIFVPGWEDSTMGNCFVSRVLRKELSSFSPVRSGFEQMQALVEWYLFNSMGGANALGEPSLHSEIGFFRIGGGIAGDFPICVVPMIESDLQRGVPCWKYFCQISDSTTSYGSYSGAVPNEKITWGKIEAHTPQFMIESDATIVAPLIFAYVLNW